MRLQRFERMFFEMLRLHNQIVNAMRIEFVEQRVDEETGPEVIKTPVTGRHCFSEFDRGFEQWLGGQYCSSNDQDERIDRAYRNFWYQNQEYLGHYFPHLYRLFSFIDGSENVDKLLYSGIVRAQLSDLELKLLYCNCASVHGKDEVQAIGREIRTI